MPIRGVEELLGDLELNGENGEPVPLTVTLAEQAALDAMTGSVERRGEPATRRRATDLVGAEGHSSTEEPGRARDRVRRWLSPRTLERPPRG